MIGRITIQDSITCDDPTVDLIEPHFMAKFSVPIGLAPADNVGMGLKQAHQFFWGWNLLFLKDTSHGLVDHLLDARNERFECVAQSPRLV